MGLRDRLKNRISNLFVGPTHTDPPAHSQPAAPPRTPVPAPKEPAPAAKTAAPKATAPTPAPAKAAVDPEQAKKDAVMAAKAAKHLERTRRAMLKLVMDNDGSAALGDMHDLSERRYFIGHKKFSNMMEALTEENLLNYNASDGIATITEQGRSYLETDA